MWPLLYRTLHAHELAYNSYLARASTSPGFTSILNVLAQRRPKARQLVAMRIGVSISGARERALSPMEPQLCVIDPLFQNLARSEQDHLAWGDRDCLTGLGIAAHPFFLVAN